MLAEHQGISQTGLSEALSVFASVAKSSRILVIGDLMLDAYWKGSVERISPEAPVPILNLKTTETRLGGAANVALNLKAMGAQVSIATILGEDDAANQALELLKSSDIAPFYRQLPRPTTIKTRVMGNGAQMLRIDQETDEPVSALEAQAFLDMILPHLHQFQLILFEDYDKGAITPSIIKAVVQRAKELGIPVTVDPKHRNFNQYCQVSLFKPNLKELAIGLGIHSGELSSLDHLYEAAFDVLATLDADAVLITLSERGALWVDKSGFRTWFKAFERNIADVSGAGDTVIAVASLALLAQLSPTIILALSNLAGGLACEKIGVNPLSWSELFAAAQSDLILQRTT